MLEGLYNIFIFIWQILTNPYVLFTLSILIYLVVAHNYLVIKSYSGTLKDKIKMMLGDTMSFRHTVSYHNIEYEQRMISELNSFFEKYSYDAEASLDIKNGGYKIKGNTPSKPVGYAILAWIGLKLIFVPYLCRSEVK